VITCKRRGMAGTGMAATDWQPNEFEDQRGGTTLIMCPKCCTPHIYLREALSREGVFVRNVLNQIQQTVVTDADTDE
jgi:hypothetical protein